MVGAAETQPNSQKLTCRNQAKPAGFTEMGALAQYEAGWFTKCAGALCCLLLALCRPLPDWRPHVDPSRQRARLRRPWLATLVPHVLVRRLLFARSHGLSRPPRHQRRPRRGWEG